VKLLPGRRSPAETNGTYAARDDLDDAVERIEQLAAERAEAEAVRVHDDAASKEREKKLVADSARGRIDRDKARELIRAESDGRRERALNVKLYDDELRVLRAVVNDFTDRWLRDALARCDDDDAEIAQEEQRLLHALAGARAKRATIDARRDRIRQTASAIREVHDAGYRKAMEGLRRQQREANQWLAKHRPSAAREIAGRGDREMQRAIETERERIRYERNIMADVAERGFRELGLEHPQPDAIAKLRGEPVPERPDPNETRSGERFTRIER
jgi:hypothetical protein